MNTVFITGGTTGIGKQLALDYANDGHAVGICGRSSEKFTEDLQKITNIKFYKVDVSDLDQINNAVSNFVKEHGKIDSFYANAGIGAGAKSHEPALERDFNVMDINVKGFLNSFAAVLPHMMKQKYGKIVTVSSLGALFGLPGNAGYCASKAFVRTYSESMSIDLKNFGIQVTCILPGYVSTPLTDKNNHAMPFLIDTVKASNYIRNAVKKGKLYYGFPWFFSSLVHILGYSPKFVLHFLLGRLKYR